MLGVKFNFNHYYIVCKRGSCHSNSIPKELRKSMDLPRVTDENLYVNNITQYLMHFISSWYENETKFGKEKANSKATKHFSSYQ